MIWLPVGTSPRVGCDDPAANFPQRQCPNLAGVVYFQRASDIEAQWISCDSARKIIGVVVHVSPGQRVDRCC